MSTQPPSALPFADVIPPELAADTQAVLEKLTTGRPLDDQARERIRRDAQQVGEAIRREHGVLDIGVPAIRELRDA